MLVFEFTWSEKFIFLHYVAMEYITGVTFFEMDAYEVRIGSQTTQDNYMFTKVENPVSCLLPLLQVIQIYSYYITFNNNVLNIVLVILLVVS